MDINNLKTESPKILTVINAIRNDPDFLDELKANPQDALNKIGVELNEEELSIVQKLGGLEEEAEGFLDKIKGIFGGSKETH